MTKQLTATQSARNDAYKQHIGSDLHFAILAAIQVYRVENTRFPTYKEIHEYLVSEGFELDNTTISSRLTELRKTVLVESVKVKGVRSTTNSITAEGIEFLAKRENKLFFVERIQRKDPAKVHSGMDEAFAEMERKSEILKEEALNEQKSQLQGQYDEALISLKKETAHYRQIAVDLERTNKKLKTSYEDIDAEIEKRAKEKARVVIEVIKAKVADKKRKGTAKPKISKVDDDYTDMRSRFKKD